MGLKEEMVDALHEITRLVRSDVNFYLYDIELNAPSSKY